MKETGKSLTREDWLTAAIQVLVESGIGSISIVQLAVSLGVTRGSFYHHFSDREDLLRAMLSYWEEKWTIEIREEVRMLDLPPGKISVIEFDYTVENAVVYDKNGVTIRSIPAIHAGDGPVSFILEYAGMKIVIGGDTYPNKWDIKHAVDADVAIREVFLTREELVE